MANPNRTNQPEIEKSEQTLINQSFDREFNVLAVEPLVYNPKTGAVDRVSVGFAEGVNVTTDLSTPGTIVQTDGVKTYTATITSTSITEVWS